MPDTSNNPFVCMAAYSVLQRNIRAPVWRQTKRPPENRRPTDAGKGGCLFGGDLPRRIERAGIVDLRDLMVGKAKNLAQDFVGMFAEQRRAQHLGRAVRQFDRVADRQVLAAFGMIDL